MEKSPKSPNVFTCKTCNYTSGRLSEFNRHLSTAKHIRLTNPNNKSPKSHICECGKSYNHAASLCKHKKKCSAHPPPLENTFVEVADINDKRDKMIEEIMKDSLEMKNLIVILIKSNQELAEKQGDVTVGNTTNSHNPTLNFYLTNTCKDAESIHDFTDRFVERSIEFFKENFRQVAANQVDLAASVYDIMNKCLDEKPQIEKFIQTTDAKNGVLYVKEKKKDEKRQLYGEAEFVKHMDGFEKTGINLEHAINKAFLPMKDEFTELMKLECGNPPDEDNFEDEDEYENELNKYKERTMEFKRNMCIQTYNTSTVFDKKQIRDEILARTKRIKEQQGALSPLSTTIAH